MQGDARCYFMIGESKIISRADDNRMFLARWLEQVKGNTENQILFSSRIIPLLMRIGWGVLSIPE
ncbi:Uncharacterised protein [Legionella pneumophila]|nr:Uncharacterised protein [Legionella pneumophila]CZG31225.1 Uncharacterised protein [Legionella pneumophila]